MNPKCHRCGAPATAGPDPALRIRQICLTCAAVETITLPPTPERKAPAPPELRQGPAWTIAEAMAPDGELWNHQATALNLLAAGDNVVIATPTASGKSLVFQLWTIHRLRTDPQATAAVFYPTKALANDQERRWKAACQQAGLPAEAVARIDGDVPMNQRSRILSAAQIVLMTPDVCHAWLLRTAQQPSAAKFLAHLSQLILDEAHTYESVFGSNSAYLFRRIIAAAKQAGNPANPQVTAATATILAPDQHLNKLTGLDFQTVELDQSGSPRHQRTIHHLESTGRTTSDEQLAARLIASIIDSDPNSQIIVFHDSRQGIERIVQQVNRPKQVLPYRSGYLAQDRRAIETSLRENTIRAVVATSALELGIDMPDLNYGINLGLPPSRKQFHQRLGRIGRSQPGAFVLLAPYTQFTQYGDNLQTYYRNSVEPSNLYLENEHIAYHQALCLRQELQTLGGDSRTQPQHCNWPEGFSEALRNAHGRPPAHLAQRSVPTEQSPHLAHSIRSTGEEHLNILACRPLLKEEELIGSISVSQAMREAYPGAIHHHYGNSYRAEQWSRRSGSMQPVIRMTPLPQSRERTRPISRTTATINTDPNNPRPPAQNQRHNGAYARIQIQVTESVEGYEIVGQGVFHYQDTAKTDPHKSRKQRSFPTTALLLTIEDAWFQGQAGPGWQARSQLAEALKNHLAYRRSIAVPDLSHLVDNIFIETKQGYLLSEASLLVFDDIYGGLGLVDDLYRNLNSYAQNLAEVTRDAADLRTAQVYPENAAALLDWLNQEPEPYSPTPPAENDWWRVLKIDSPITFYSPNLGATTNGAVQKPVWNDGIAYQVKATQHEQPRQEMTIPEFQLQAADSADWQLWNPSQDQYVELLTG